MHGQQSRDPHLPPCEILSFGWLQLLTARLERPYAASTPEPVLFNPLGQPLWKRCEAMGFSVIYQHRSRGAYIGTTLLDTY